MEDNKPSWLSRHRGDILACAVLAAMTLAVFWKAFVDAPDMIRGDAAYLYQPYYTMAADEVREGRIPLWNPYIIMGVPFHATLQPALFYPLRWPMFFMDYIPGYIFTLCLHYFLGAVAAFIFIRVAMGVGPLAALVGAMSIAFGGFSMGHLSHPNYFLSYPWFFSTLLFVWLAVKRGQWRWIVPAGICVGLMGLIGSVHLLLVLGVLLGAYAAYHAIVALVAVLRDRANGWLPVVRPIATVAAAVVLGGAIAAVQILPAQKLSKASSRQNRGWEFINMGCAHPERNSLQMIVPFYYGDHRIGYWGEFSHDELAHYTGIAVLLLAAAGLFTLGRDRHLWVLVVLAVVGFTLGAGKYLPFYKVLYDLVPAFDKLRNPTRIFWCTDIALGCLAALGVQRVLLADAPQQLWRRSRVAITVMAAIAVITIVAAMLQLRQYAQHPQQAEAVLSGILPIPDSWTSRRIEGAHTALAAIFRPDAAIWGGLAAAVISAALVSILVWRKRIPGRVATAAIVALLACDLLAMSGGMVMYDKFFQVTQGTPPLAQWLKDHLGLQRYAALHGNEADDIQPNRGMQFGFRNIGGLGGGIVDTPGRSAFEGVASWAAVTDAKTKIVTWPLMKLAGVKYVFIEKALGGNRNALGDSVVHEDDRYLVCQNSALPMAYFVEGVDYLGDPLMAQKLQSVRQMVAKAHQQKSIPEGIAMGIYANPLLGVLMSEAFDANRLAVTSEPPPAQTAHSTAREKSVTQVTTTPGRWEIQTQTDAPAQLVLTEGFDAGWRCEIGGQDAHVYQTNDQFMSVAVPGGKNTVVFKYDQPGFRTGAIITVVATAATLGLLAIGFFVRKKTPDEALAAATGVGTETSPQQQSQSKQDGARGKGKRKNRRQ